MLQAAAAAKSHVVKAHQAQTAHTTSSADRPQSAFENMLDEAQASASADPNAATPAPASQNQATPAAKGKVDPTTGKPVPETKVTAEATPADPALPVQPDSALGDAKAPKVDAAVPSDTGGKPATETKKKDDSTGDPAKPADASAVTTPSPAPAAVPVAQPVAPTLPAPAPTQPAVTADAAPAIETGEKPAQTVTATPQPAGPAPKQAAAKKPAVPGQAEQPDQGDQAAETGETAQAETTVAADAPVKAEKTDKTAKTNTATAATDQTIDAPQPTDDGDAATQTVQPGQAQPGKAPQVALSDADKEHIAHARGEVGDDSRGTMINGKETQADAATTLKAATADVTTPQVQTATAAHAANTTSATAAPAPQTPMPTAVAVPLAGLGVEIASRATSGRSQFEIRLDPAELGRIEVRLNVDRDGNVTSHLIADRQDTLDLLKRDSAGLERALQDAGLKTSDNAMQFSLRDQSAGQQQNGHSGHDGGSRTARVVVQDDSMPSIDASVQNYGRLAGRLSGLDIRV